MEPEIWKSVVGYEGLYGVSSLGRVRSLDRYVVGRFDGQQFKRGRILRQGSTEAGYRFVQLARDGRYTLKLVAGLVAGAFLGPRPEGRVVAHGDGNNSNNVLGNLRYATHAENEADKLVHGTALRGERHHQAKLTEQDVREIRVDARPAREVATAYGVFSSTIAKIRRRVTWRHVV